MAKSFPYDAACKALFGQEIVFRSLLTGFGVLRTEDAAAITGMRRLPANLETEEGERRMADLIWEVNFPGGTLHVILEFQRNPDRTMANRMAVYCHLHMAAELAKKPGPLRAVLPIVIYLGESPWHCPRSLRDMYAPPPAAMPVPLADCSYFLLDAHRLPLELVDRAGPGGFLFQLEMAKDYTEAFDAADGLIQTCQGEQFGRLRRIAMNLLHAYTVNEGWTDDFRSPLSEEDASVMLGRLRKLQQEENRRLMAEGEAKGRAEGEARGRAEGEARGRAEGEARGEARGLKRQLNGLLALMAQRFGSVPENWRHTVEAISNPDAVNGLLLDTYGCATAEEFEARLLQAAKS